VIDPDDSGPRLSVTLKEPPVDEIYALPTAQTEQITPIATAVAAPVPPPPDLLDSAVHRRTRAKVAAFMLYELPEPAPWREERQASAKSARRGD
jgi:hypothetical protein